MCRRLSALPAAFSPPILVETVSKGLLPPPFPFSKMKRDVTDRLQSWVLTLFPTSFSFFPPTRLEELGETFFPFSSAEQVEKPLVK